MSTTAVRVAVRSALAMQLDTSDFGDDDPLFDLAVDSIDVIVVVTALEDQLGVRVPDAEIFRAETWSVSALVRLFAVASGTPA